jgi:dihydroxyacetone kinase phosphotransfer subunit
MNGAANVGIVIVSHSADVARGAADMVRQMVGAEVPLAWCGGDPEGGLGTSVPAVMRAIDAAWSERGVAILVDLGGAETNSEMAIEMMPAEKRGRIVICNAPIVEGAVIAATEASGSSSLDDVRNAAEELYPRSMRASDA